MNEMDHSKYSITFACHNSVEYTKKCIESMINCNTPLDRLVVVDNKSSDGTVDYLKTLSLGGLILNQENLGCGVAWNQGILHLQSDWTIIMNNDVIVSKDWVNQLIHTAEKNSIKVICPALIEGPLNYDFQQFSNTASKKMKDVLRINTQHAVCLAVHRSVWMDIGYFQPVPKLLGFEDTLFFNELKKAKIKTAITGASWLHHFGSITQNAMKKERGIDPKKGLGNRKNYKLLQQNWLERKINKLNQKNLITTQKSNELELYEMTIHGIRDNAEFIWL
jgi:N-acetylglucosaminyl-diphospho-decaprenol L-rhamnosyltransferase